MSRFSRDSRGFVILSGSPSGRLRIEEITQFSMYVYTCNKGRPRREIFVLKEPAINIVSLYTVAEHVDGRTVNGDLFQ